MSVATILITNRECPWKCVFCDLWKNTLDETVPSGAIPEQIRTALVDLPAARWIKLYNAGSFFDPRAIPPGDVPAITDLLGSFDRVIVECHPALIDEGAGSSVIRFRDLLRTRSIGSSSPIDAPPASDTSPDNQSHLIEGACPPQESDPTREPIRAIASLHHPISNPAGRRPFPRLEVAMGLETVHPLALERLNKGMTLDDFARAADVLRKSDIDLRAFVLVQPPFTPPEEAVHWALRSLDFARDQGARLVAFIPTRGGNDAMEALAATGDFVPPRLSTLEEVLDRGLESSSSHGGPLVVADLWDLERFSRCPTCFPARSARLGRMNLSQQVEPRIPCDCAS
ncbi:MAG: radical SAM protein [Planctomycetota bacterium]